MQAAEDTVMISTRKIVIIDDTPEVLELLEVVLMDDGFEVVSCDSACEALETVAREHPALVIADLRMAGVERWELVDGLLSDQRTAGVPVIVCSGAVSELQAAEKHLQARGGGILTKPFDVQQLLDLVRRLILASESRDGRSQGTG